MSNKDLRYYEKQFAHLNVNKIGGQVAPHKPILLLAIMDLAECEIIMLPQIELSESPYCSFQVELGAPCVQKGTFQTSHRHSVLSHER